MQNSHFKNQARWTLEHSSALMAKKDSSSES